jgi:zinc transport system substrate-binding protein
MLAGGAQVVSLADTPGLIRLPARDGAVFEAHDHNTDNHNSDETDPHLWLDPENAALWLDAIAAALAGADPVNQALYLANAGQAKIGLAALTARIDARLAPFRGRPFIVYHDAFYYFENRFGIEAAGAVAMGDARAPGPARIARIRARILELSAAKGTLCLFLEPQFRSPLAATLAQDTGVKIGLLDPLGSELAPGSELYPRLLSRMADSFADCLG